MQGRPAHLRRRARVRGLAPDFVCNMTKQRTKSNKSLWVLLGGALLLRLVLALVTDGYPYDMSCFVAWGDKLAAEGPAAFTARATLPTTRPATSGCWDWWGAIRAALHIAYESKWTYFLLALVPSLCDCGLAWLVYRTAKRSSRSVKEHTALVLTAFTAFNPLMLFDTGVWKQIDGAFALPLVLCFCAAGAAALPARRRAVRRGAGHQAAGAAVRPGAGGVLSGGNCAGKGPPARLWPLLLAARRWHCCRRC